MRERSALWQKTVARGDFGLDVEAVIGGEAYTAISAPVIERALCDSALSVGNCCAASLRFSILTKDAIPPSSEVAIRARLRRGEDVTEWKEFGTFFIDRREEQEGLITLQCFDAMLKASQQYADPTDPEDRIGWPKTMQDCVEEIAYRIGVGIDPRTVINTAAPYQVPYPDRLTMQQVLGHIGACHGGNWIITPENKLRLVVLASPPAETFNIVDYEYNKIFTGGGYKLVWKHTETGETLEHPAGGGLVQVPVVTGSITTGQGVTVTRTTIAADEDLGYTKGDSTSGEIRIEDNPYLAMLQGSKASQRAWWLYNGFRYAGVYSSTSWFRNILTGPVFERYDKWVAQWASACELQKPYGIWQFTDRLYIDGVQLDCNYAYKDYPSLTGGKSTVSKKSRVLATQENHITNPFGNGHSGVDLGWQTTQTDGVLAHSGGQVVFCQTGQQNNKGSSGNASYGNCVKIKHPNGYATLYAHLSEVNVSYGQTVEKCQQIGHMGNTGNSYGNHLHFEVRNKNDTCIDPAPYIAADLPGLITEKEDADMTEDRVREITWEESARQNPTYNTLEDVPDYWREDIARLVEDGIIKGTGDGKLGLTRSEVKAAVIVKRAMEKA